MKLAWLCYEYENSLPVIWFTDPTGMGYEKVVQIVYSEIIE